MKFEVPASAAELTSRALTPSDSSRLFNLLQRIENHDDAPYRSTHEEVDDLVASGWQGLTDNSLALVDAEDELRAFGVVTEPEYGGRPRSFLEGGVDPQFRQRGLGSAILNWQIDRAHEMLEFHDGGELIVQVDDQLDHAAELVKANGFNVGGYHSELRRKLDGLTLVEPQLERPLELLAWNKDLDDAIRLAHGEAFGPQQQPPSRQRWLEGRAYFVPEWSFLVLDRTSDRAQVAGYLLASKYEQDWEGLGWSEGYVDMLGVREPWRGRGIATALLTRTLISFANSGMEYAALGVDHPGRDDSFGLFDKFGFATDRGSTTYVIKV